MNLGKKKKLAERTLGVGKKRIVFVESRLNDIKEAITKQDIRDLYNDGAIIIKTTGGRRKIKGKSSRSKGNIRKKAKNRKKGYVLLTRKLRAYLADLRKQEKISDKDLKDARKKIRNRAFKSKNQIKEYLKQ